MVFSSPILFTFCSYRLAATHTDMLCSESAAYRWQHWAELNPPLIFQHKTEGSHWLHCSHNCLVMLLNHWQWLVQNFASNTALNTSQVKAVVLDDWNDKMISKRWSVVLAKTILALDRSRTVYLMELYIHI